MRRIIKGFLPCCCLLSFLIGCGSYQFDGLLTWEEYNKLPRFKPYILELKTSKGQLLYYGAFHTVNLNSPQIMDIEERWKDFEPTLVFCEGGVRPLKKTREDAICQYGEQGLLRFLASRDNVSIRSIEPPKTSELLYLLRYFSCERLKIFYILRQTVVNRVLLKKNPEDIQFITGMLNNLSQMKALKGKPNSLEEFEASIRRLLPSLEDWRFISSHTFFSNDPQNWISQINLKVNRFRDQNMLKTLFKELKKGERVFAVVGRSHVVMQEPVLRSFIETIDIEKTKTPNLASQPSNLNR